MSGYNPHHGGVSTNRADADDRKTVVGEGEAAQECNNGLSRGTFIKILYVGPMII